MLHFSDKICKLWKACGRCVVEVWTMHPHLIKWVGHILVYYERRQFSIAPFVPISVNLFTGFLEAYLNTLLGIFTFVTVNPSASFSVFGLSILIAICLVGSDRFNIWSPVRRVWRERQALSHVSVYLSRYRSNHGDCSSITHRDRHWDTPGLASYNTGQNFPNYQAKS